MSHFLDFLSNIKSAILISSSDSEVDKAKKIIWYAFFGALIMLIVVPWVIFTTSTFSAEIVKVPYIEKDDIYKALKKLSDKKLVANVTPRYSDLYEEGIVFSQSPVQGSTIKHGEDVTFFVSLGTHKDALEDFRGFSLFEFATELDKNYHNSEIPFKIKTPIYEDNEKIEKGRIIKQEPAEGTPLNNVKTIQLWVSKGPKEVGKPTLSNYKERNLEDVSRELADKEVPYTITFNPVKSRDEELLVTEQSIGEGLTIEEIIEKKKILLLTVNKLVEKGDDNIQGEFIYDVPKKPLPFELVIKLKDAEAIEEELLRVMTKGGISIALPYSAPKFSRIITFIDGVQDNEFEIQEPIDEGNIE